MVAGSIPWLIVESEENRQLGGGNDQRIRARAWTAATGEGERKRMASRVIAQDRYNGSAPDLGNPHFSGLAGTPHAFELRCEGIRPRRIAPL
jgi:hypothetical protein